MLTSLRTLASAATRIAPSRTLAAAAAATKGKAADWRTTIGKPRILITGARIGVIFLINL